MDSTSGVLDRLSAEIYRDLQGETVTLQQKLEAFKILSAREAAMGKKSTPRRLSDPEPDDEDDSAYPDFQSMQKKIRRVS